MSLNETQVARLMQRLDALESRLRALPSILEVCPTCHVLWQPVLERSGARESFSKCPVCTLSQKLADARSFEGAILGLQSSIAARTERFPGH